MWSEKKLVTSRGRPPGPPMPVSATASHHHQPIYINFINIKNMPVDKFGRRHTAVQENVSSDVSFTQIGDYFIKREGSNTAIGSINMTGNTLKMLAYQYTITMRLINYTLTDVQAVLLKFQGRVIRCRVI